MAPVADVSLLLGDLDGAQATFPTLRQLLDEVTDPGPAVFELPSWQCSTLPGQSRCPALPVSPDRCLRKIRRSSPFQYLNRSRNQIAVS